VTAMKVREESITSEILRKVMHVVFALLLAIPLTPPYRSIFGYEQSFLDPTLLTYSILLFASSLINSIQIRLPNIEETFVNMSREHRKRFLEYINESFAATPFTEFVKGIEKLVNRFENQLLFFINTVKRDYERRYGYVSITFALISILLSYVIWKDYNYTSIYIGILALAIIDGLTSIISIIDKKTKRILKHTLLAYIITLVVFAILLYFITYKPLLSFIVSLSAIIIEMLSPEDNLTLPFLVTSLFCLLYGRV
jgi:dolichol kinase